MNAILPEDLHSAIEEQTGERIRSVRNVSGGSINRAAMVELSGAGDCFLKWNSEATPDLFVKEVRGLQLLREADSGLRIPAVLDQGLYRPESGYLLLEYVAEGSGGAGSAERFGRKLVRQHRHRQVQYGLSHNNYIGKLPQSNRPHEQWVDFFVEERLQPQVKMAREAGRLPASLQSSFEALYRRLPELLPEEPPSLLHGDLWGGNYFFDGDGEAVLYDPAVYYGNREIELAFTRMFGGFPEPFYRAYREAWPLQPDFDRRVELYNLYPLLVHTNLFGGHYGQQVQSVVSRF